jgi:hypothetical protein
MQRHYHISVLRTELWVVKIKVSHSCFHIALLRARRLTAETVWFSPFKLRGTHLAYRREDMPGSWYSTQRPHYCNGSSFHAILCLHYRQLSCYHRSAAGKFTVPVRRTVNEFHSDLLVYSIFKTNEHVVLLCHYFQCFRTSYIVCSKKF